LLQLVAPKGQEKGNVARAALKIYLRVYTHGLRFGHATHCEVPEKSLSDSILDAIHETSCATTLTVAARSLHRLEARLASRGADRSPRATAFISSCSDCSL
jgi:hypothetical protein